jgi:hypothetical protein
MKIETPKHLTIPQDIDGELVDGFDTRSEKNYDDEF